MQIAVHIDCRCLDCTQGSSVRMRLIENKDGKEIMKCEKCDRQIEVSHSIVVT